MKRPKPSLLILQSRCSKKGCSPIGSKGFGVSLVSPPNRLPFPPHNTTASVAAGFNSEANEKSPRQQKNLYESGKTSYSTRTIRPRQALYRILLPAVVEPRGSPNGKT